MFSNLKGTLPLSNLALSSLLGSDLREALAIYFEENLGIVPPSPKRPRSSLTLNI